MLSFFKRKEKSVKSLLADGGKHPRAQFFTLQVEDIRKETADSVSIGLAIPENLEESFRYQHGQYITFKKTLNGEELRRSYSICSSPLDGELRVAIKKVEGGRFSTWANETLQVGDYVEVMTPEGRFTSSLNAKATKQYVGFAAGSGITPLMSIIKTTLELEPKSSFILFYGNKSSASIMFKQELEDLKDRFLNRLEVHHVLSREDQGTDLLKGRISGEKCSSFAAHFFTPTTVAEYFICGPEAMIHEVRDTLSSLGVASEKIHFELFSTPTQAAVQSLQTKSGSAEPEVLSAVTVILDGEETHFNISSKGNTILDAALDAGADVPFACKGAVCCTCRAKVMEGEVEMEMNYALMDDEVQDGYILTCQSHPKTDRVVVSFDE